jgi:hypothetical protein
MALGDPIYIESRRNIHLRIDISIQRKAFLLRNTKAVENHSRQQSSSASRRSRIIECIE